MTERLGVLDGLRAIAVLLVLAHHVWKGTGYLLIPFAFIPGSGFLGVDLFFFLSGFVIAYPFVRSLIEGAKPPTWRHFYFRRGLKILPSYWLSIAFAYAIGYAALQAAYGWPIDLGAHLLFLHTWLPGEWGAINGVLWTLGVEVQFYCLFPALWLAFSRWPWLTAIACLAGAPAWRIASLWLAPSVGYFEFFSRNVPGYLDVFMAGILAAYVWVRFKPRFAWGPAVALVAAGCVLAMWDSMFSSCLFRYPGCVSVWQVGWRTPMALCFALIALGFLAAPMPWQRLLDNRVLRFVAIISYNLYLYQVIVADCLHAPTRPLYAVLVVAVSVAIATVVTYAFERPLLRMKHG